jgi:DNA-binding transcriptional ArsR family regulator
MAETVIVLEPGEEKATKIAKAMASQTASDILKFIGEGPKTSTEISERLSLPMNTAKYHIENLLDAGLISVSATKYSVKGREVKVYSLTNQLLIVAPRQSNVHSLLLKYVSLFGIVVLGSLVISLLFPILASYGGINEGINAVPRAPVQEAGAAFAKATSDAGVGNASSLTGATAALAKATLEIAAGNASAPPDATAALTKASADAIVSAPPSALDPAFAFLCGGVLVIFVLVCYEVYLWRKMR